MQSGLFNHPPSPIQTVKTGSGTMNLGGSLTRQTESDQNVNDASPHIANIGRMVEVCCMWPCISVSALVMLLLHDKSPSGHGEQDSFHNQ